MKRIARKEVTVETTKRERTTEQSLERSATGKKTKKQRRKAGRGLSETKRVRRKPVLKEEK